MGFSAAMTLPSNLNVGGKNKRTGKSKNSASSFQDLFRRSFTIIRNCIVETTRINENSLSYVRYDHPIRLDLLPASDC